MPTLTEIRENYFAKSKALDDIFVQAGEDMDMSKVTLIDGDSTAKAAEIKRRMDEVNDLGADFDRLKTLDDAAKVNRGRLDFLGQPRSGLTHPASTEERQAQPAEIKSAGQQVIESAEYKAAVGSELPRFRVYLPNVDLKTTVSLTAGFSQAPVRTNIVIESAQRRPIVADLVPQDDTAANAIRFMRETTFTNNAAPVAETGTKPESALAWTEVTVPVEVIAHLIPITRQQLDDVPAMRGLIENRMVFMLQLAEENQLLNGNGTSPQLTGFYNVSGIQTQAKGTDPTPDAIYRAFTLVRWTGFAEPSGVVMHPNDWQDIRLLRTADGVYIWGSPADAGPERIWGKPVIVTTAATQNTALTGDFRMFSHISRRMGMTVDVTDSHASTFATNILTMRVEERLSLEVYRPAAFATITGI